jgi:hypothetical protein
LRVFQDIERKKFININNTLRWCDHHSMWKLDRISKSKGKLFACMCPYTIVHTYKVTSFEICGVVKPPKIICFRDQSGHGFGRRDLIQFYLRSPDTMQFAANDHTLHPKIPLTFFRRGIFPVSITFLRIFISLRIAFRRIEG